MRTWLLVALLLTVGVFAGACSSGDDDASPTTTPVDSGGAVTGTPSDGTEGGSPTPADGPTDGTDRPADGTGSPADGTDGGPEAPGGPPPINQPPPPGAGPAMRLTILDGGSCDGSECFVDTGATFTLAVEVLGIPASGYILMQTFIEYGIYDPSASEDGAGPGSCSDGIIGGDRDGADRRDEDCVVVDLTYLPTASVADELFWTDLATGTALRADNLGPGLVGHGGLTGLVPPLPVSNETGVMTRLRMSCPANAVTVPISLLEYEDPFAGTSGSLFVRPDAVQITPFVSGIILHCQ